MRYYAVLLAVGMFAGFTAPSPAGIFFGKHPKPSPAERVSQLLMIVKTNPDDNRRANAVRELRAFDPRAFPQIVPVLIDVLKRDQQATVRLEAAQTLGKLRPISQEAGMALEEAVSDPSLRVRWQARQALVGYRIGGYRSPPKLEENARLSGKPVSNAGPSGTPPAKRSLLPLLPAKSGPTIVPNETPPPPLADPLPAASSDPPAK